MLFLKVDFLMVDMLQNPFLIPQIVVPKMSSLCSVYRLVCIKTLMS